MTTARERFEAWIIKHYNVLSLRSEGEEIDGVWTYYNDAVQHRWESWQAAERAAKIMDGAAHEAEAEHEPSPQVNYYRDLADAIRSLVP